MKEYSFDEVYALTGTPLKTLDTRRRRGKLHAIKRFNGKKPYWVILQSTLDCLLQAKKETKPTDDYDTLIQEWQRDLATGYLTGKPALKTTLDNYGYGLKYLWQYMAKSPNIKLITADNVRIAIANVPIDYEKESDKYAVRERMYIAVRSFCKFLIEKKLMDKIILLDLQQAKPKRVFKPKPRKIHLADFEEVLRLNETISKGRTLYDKALNRTLFMLMGMAGLRATECCTLALDDLDMRNQEFTLLGKGSKRRRIGITPELFAQLSIWLNIRKQTPLRNLLIKRTGNALTRYNVRDNLQTIQEKLGKPLNPHAFRHFFASHMVNSGKLTVVQVQLILGHNDIDTTMLYVKADEQTAVNAMKHWQAQQSETAEIES